LCLKRKLYLGQNDKKRLTLFQNEFFKVYLKKIKFKLANTKMTNSLSKNFSLLPISFKRELSLKSFLALTGGSLIGLACFYLGKIWYSYRFFAKMNIKTPKFKYLYGNLAEIMKNVIIDFIFKNSCKNYYLLLIRRIFFHTF